MQRIYMNYALQKQSYCILICRYFKEMRTVKLWKFLFFTWIRFLHATFGLIHVPGTTAFVYELRSTDAHTTQKKVRSQLYDWLGH